MPRDEAGQITVFVVGIALVCFAVAGIAVDGTRAWLYRRTLQNAADSSALAGAAELDVSDYYEGGGDRADIDLGAARRVAARWVADAGLDVQSGYAIDESGVLVGLRGRVPTTFLGLIGVDSLPVAVEARAEPRRGEP
jgi:Flp pilus assembly protein TadG